MERPTLSILEPYKLSLLVQFAFIDLYPYEKTEGQIRSFAIITLFSL